MSRKQAAPAASGIGAESPLRAACESCKSAFKSARPDISVQKLPHEFDCENQAGVFHTGEADQADLPRASGFSEHTSQRGALRGNRVQVRPVHAVPAQD